MSVLRSLAKYSSIPIHYSELNKIAKYGRMELCWQPIFIIGAPRTGSTILYELLTNHFDVIYPDNLAEIFFRNIYFGFWLSQRIYGHTGHNTFHSKFGNTENYGKHAPNEYAGYWFRWIPRNMHYIPAGYLSSKAIIEIKESITAVINRYGKPLLYKNLNLGQRMGMLSEIFPECKFIFIKRNPVFTVQSLFLAKRKLGYKENDWWSVMPQNVNKLKMLPEIERLVKQVFFTERQIYLDSRLFPDENLLLMEYEELSSNLNTVYKKIHDFIGEKVMLRENKTKPVVKLRDEKRIHKNVFKNIENEVSQLDWQNYGIN